MKDRERIIKEIEKNKKKTHNLIVVDRAADAEVVLLYSVTNEEWVSSIKTNRNSSGSGSTSTPIYMDSDTGVVCNSTALRRRYALVNEFQRRADLSMGEKSSHQFRPGVHEGVS